MKEDVKTGGGFRLLLSWRLLAEGNGERRRKTNLKRFLDSSNFNLQCIFCMIFILKLYPRIIPCPPLVAKFTFLVNTAAFFSFVTSGEKP